MARSFIYDNIGFSEATTTEGYFSGGTFYPNTARFTDEERLIDMSIGSAVSELLTDGSGWDMLMFDLGAADNADAVAVYFTAEETNNLRLYAGSSATAVSSIKEQMDETFVAGWNVFDFTQTSNRYWFLTTPDGGINGLTEIIVGTRYTFDVNPELNAKTGEEFGTDIMTSYGGNEYANKRHEPKTTWDWNWSHILSTQKTALEDMNASVQDWKKFIYSEDATTHHYVRMTKPVTFTEVAPSVYSANMSLREQLS